MNEFGSDCFDAVIIGAGGAGMMTALEAARRKRRVLLVDHSEKIGRKILISGGGRCNFTNIHTKAENYHSANPHFAKSALSRYTPADFIKLVEAHRIKYHEKKLGQLFCDGSAQQIVDMLVSECRKNQVEFLLASKVKHLEKTADGFKIHLQDQQLSARSVVVASGGLSIPKIGASGYGYELAKQFGLKVEDTFAALVGFNLKEADKTLLNELSGVSFDSLVKCGKQSFRENTLFTHTGLSGPAILQASLYWSPGKALHINTSPSGALSELITSYRKQKSNKELKNILAEIYPRSLAEKFCQLFLESRPLNSLADITVENLCAKLTDWTLYPQSNFGYGKAEVTGGGVSTSELSAKTMEARKIPGLFFVGEVVDVTGQLGGYNFQWAWASGFAAGQAL